MPTLTEITSQIKFPSPCGERVLLNIEKMYDPNVHTQGIKFPSPCGERVLLNLRVNLTLPSTYFQVSVPLRGKGSVELQIGATPSGSTDP